jgi:hypothetical protein
MPVSRQTEPGGVAAGIGAALRLDPAHLPARFAAPDRGADGGQRSIDLSTSRVVIRRTASGARMKLQLAVSAYRGVAVRIREAGPAQAEKVEVVLVHADPGDTSDVVAEWQRWGTALAMPLLITHPDGSLREAVSRMGGVLLGKTGPRRRRRSALRARRPQALMRRKPGRSPLGQPVHCEREIIART